MTSLSNTLSLIIDTIEEGKFIALASSPLGEARANITLPFDIHNIEAALLKFETDSDVEEFAKDFGIELFDLLFPGEIGNLLAANRAAIKSDESLNVRLQFNNKATTLARLPWELLHDGSRFLVSSGWISLTRYINLAQRIPSSTISLPFRLLIIISRPVDVPSLDNTAERDAIISGLTSLEEGDLSVDVLQPTTHDHLVEVLSTQTYDAIHFDGHGAFIDENGFLVFETEHGEKDLIDAQTISNTLSKTGTRLIVLSACQSATVGMGSMFQSVAPALTLAGIPAVIAMQFSIPVSSAIRFARQFYKSIANFDGISHALTQGRKTLFPEKDTWFIPVLYLRSESDLLFKRGRKRRKATLKEARIPHRSVKIPNSLHFVGRGSELVKLSKAISSSKSNAAVVWGSGGVGKTTLVSEYINRQYWRYPDGIVWINLLGGKSLDTILDEIFAFFTNDTLGAIPIEERIKATYELLAKKNCLIVGDNFEDVETDNRIRDFLSHLPKSVRILVTSRNHPQIIGWQAIELYKLTTSELLNLFFRMGADLGIKLPTLEDNARAHEICELLDGHPLALKLIMPMTISTSLSTIIGDLKSQPVKGISSALDTSFNALNTTAQLLLTYVSVFNSAFDEHSLRAVAEMQNWRETKDELVRRSFLYFDGSEFIVHPVIRQYAYQKLDDKKHRHLLAARHFQNTQDYFRTVDHLYQAEEWSQVVSIMHQLTSPGFMRQLPHLSDLLTRLDMALTAARNTKSDREEAMIEGDLGNVYNQTGRFKEALQHFERAYEYGVKTEDLHWQSQGLNFISSTYARMGERDEAIAFQVKSLEISRDLGDKEHLAYTLSFLGDAYLFTGVSRGKERQELDKQKEKEFTQKAIEAYEESVKLFKELGKEEPQAQPYTNLGVAYSDLKDYKKAIEYLEHSLNIKIKQNDIYGGVASLSNLAHVYENTGDFQKALEYVNVLLQLNERIALGELGSKSFARRGMLNYKLGNDVDAVADYTLACIISLQFGPETLLTIIERVEKQVAELTKDEKKEKAIELCNALIGVWRKEGLFKVAPQLVERLQVVLANL